ncbi:hypothetical protein P3L10_006530 [Capsicum annuum]|uniref:uncharacterized protein LOC107861339 n=1 Tax=Capsicum annuum TaxID=4072 RepID=UPI001FB101D2|nr:uncharacterized protein LOC107861339 [Capsicum annuum]
MASSVMSTATVATGANAAQASMVAPFNGLKYDHQLTRRSTKLFHTSLICPTSNCSRKLSTFCKRDGFLAWNSRLSTDLCTVSTASHLDTTMAGTGLCGSCPCSGALMLPRS